LRGIISVRPILKSFSVEGSIEQKHFRQVSLREKQQQAISYAFHSTLLSNPNITIEMVRRAAER
jgi:hypothetical protein